MDTSSSTRQETCVLAVSWVTGLNRYRSNYSISQGSMTETVQVLSTKLLSVISEYTPQVSVSLRCELTD